MGSTTLSINWTILWWIWKQCYCDHGMQLLINWLKCWKYSTKNNCRSEQDNMQNKWLFWWNKFKPYKIKWRIECKLLAMGLEYIVSSTAIASFQCFDSSSKPCLDNLETFTCRTFPTENSIPKKKKAQVFITNQTSISYKLVSDLIAKQSPP